MLCRGDDDDIASFTLGWLSAFLLSLLLTLVLFLCSSTAGFTTHRRRSRPVHATFIDLTLALGGAFLTKLRYDRQTW